MAKYSGPYRSDPPVECFMELLGFLRNPSEVIPKKQVAWKDWREVSDYASGVTIGDPPEVFSGAQAHAEQAVEPDDKAQAAIVEFANELQSHEEGRAQAVQFGARDWRTALKWIMENWELILKILGPLILKEQE